MREKIFITFTALGGLSVFGSLVWSSLSGDPMPFVVGYPIAFVCLVVAWIAKPVVL